MKKLQPGTGLSQRWLQRTRRAAMVAVIAVGEALAIFPAAAGETVIHAFAGGKDGSQPLTGLVVRPAGDRLFGTTFNGGKSKSFEEGTVYLLVPPTSSGGSWTKRLIHAFQGGPEDGRIPWARLTAGQKRILYGTTLEGGTADEGTVFQLTPPAAGETGWTETVLYSFQGGSDGAWPRGGVVMDQYGDLYGTTSLEGDPKCSCGTVFELSPPAPGGTAWTETVIHTFTGGSVDGVDNGSLTSGELLFDRQAFALFGATYGGGLYGLGVVYQLTPPTFVQRKLGFKTWNETLIHAFSGEADGAHPNGGLVGGAGALFGTTQSGANSACTNGCGTVFLLQQLYAGNQLYTPILLHGFFGNTTGNPPSDGAVPTAGLYRDAHNVLWGTTSEGGGSAFCDAGCGTVFKLVPNPIRVGVWSYSVEYRFFGAADGGTPTGPLAGDNAGNLYGTTAGDGGSIAGQGNGAVFEVVP
jgi:uncharacterized repeat protein (TIGR03803 family)